MEKNALLHTPGPWKITNGISRDRIDIESVSTRPEGYSNIAIVVNENATDVANANLIAAAPELLAALEDAMQALAHAIHRLSSDPQFSTSIALKFAEGKACAAIAKAKGDLQ